MGPCEHLGPDRDRLGALFSERLSVGLLLWALLRKILGTLVPFGTHRAQALTNRTHAGSVSVPFVALTGFHF